MSKVSSAALLAALSCAVATPVFAQTVSVPVTEITVETAYNLFCADKSGPEEKAVCLRQLVADGRYRLYEPRQQPRISIPDSPEGYVSPRPTMVPSHTIYRDHVVEESVTRYRDPDRP